MLMLKLIVFLCITVITVNACNYDIIEEIFDYDFEDDEGDSNAKPTPPALPPPAPVPYKNATDTSMPESKNNDTSEASKRSFGDKPRQQPKHVRRHVIRRVPVDELTYKDVEVEEGRSLHDDFKFGERYASKYPAHSMHRPERMTIRKYKKQPVLEKNHYQMFSLEKIYHIDDEHTVQHDEPEKPPQKQNKQFKKRRIQGMEKPYTEPVIYIIAPPERYPHRNTPHHDVDASGIRDDFENKDASHMNFLKTMKKRKGNMDSNDNKRNMFDYMETDPSEKEDDMGYKSIKMNRYPKENMMNLMLMKPHKQMEREEDDDKEEDKESHKVINLILGHNQQTYLSSPQTDHESIVVNNRQIEIPLMDSEIKRYVTHNEKGIMYNDDSQIFRLLDEKKYPEAKRFDHIEEKVTKKIIKIDPHDNSEVQDIFEKTRHSFIKNMFNLHMNDDIPKDDNLPKFSMHKYKPEDHSMANNMMVQQLPDVNSQKEFYEAFKEDKEESLHKHPLDIGDKTYPDAHMHGLHNININPHMHNIHTHPHMKHPSSMTETEMNAMESHTMYESHNTDNNHQTHKPMTMSHMTMSMTLPTHGMHQMHKPFDMQHIFKNPMHTLMNRFSDDAVNEEVKVENENKFEISTEAAVISDNKQRIN